jgi:hypothetical protein
MLVERSWSDMPDTDKIGTLRRAGACLRVKQPDLGGWRQYFSTPDKLADWLDAKADRIARGELDALEENPKTLEGFERQRLLKSVLYLPDIEDEKFKTYVFDAIGRPFNPIGASLKEFDEYLGSFNSYARVGALARAMTWTRRRTPDLSLRLFFEWACMCDAPWHYRRWISQILREVCTESRLIDLLEPEQSAFYNGLPALVPVWRGCQRAAQRGRHTGGQRLIERLPGANVCLCRVDEGAKLGKFGIHFSAECSHLSTTARHLVLAPDALLLQHISQSLDNRVGHSTGRCLQLQPNTLSEHSRLT